MERMEKSVTLRLEGQGEFTAIRFTACGGIVTAKIKNIRIAGWQSIDYPNASELRAFAEELLRLAEFASTAQPEDESE